MRLIKQDHVIDSTLVTPRGSAEKHTNNRFTGNIQLKEDAARRVLVALTERLRKEMQSLRQRYNKKSRGTYRMG